jgi:hypothetical protein
MHAPEVRRKFVERLAEGHSYARIAAELNVARSTLIEWSRQLRFEIQNHRALAMDELRERVLGSRQARVAAVLQKLSRVEDEIRQRDLSKVSTPQLFALSDSLRRQLERDLAEISFVAPVKDIPSNEYVEEVQQWKP